MGCGLRAMWNTVRLWAVGYVEYRTALGCGVRAMGYVEYRTGMLIFLYMESCTGMLVLYMEYSYYSEYYPSGRKTSRYSLSLPSPPPHEGD